MTFERQVKTNEIKLHSFNILEIFFRQFKNPLLIIFVVSTVAAFIFGQKFEAIAIWAIMTLSVLLGFWNEYQAEKTVSDLLKKISLRDLRIKSRASQASSPHNDKLSR